MKLVLPFYLDLDVLHLVFERLFELGLDLVEAVFKPVKGLLFTQDALVILL